MDIMVVHQEVEEVQVVLEVRLLEAVEVPLEVEEAHVDFKATKLLFLIF